MDYVCKQALLVVDPGAPNLSGVVSDLPDIVCRIVAITGQQDVDTITAVVKLRDAVRAAWAVHQSTSGVNTDPGVRAAVDHLVILATSGPAAAHHPVAAHPAMVLILSQLAQLSGVGIWPALGQWSKAYQYCLAVRDHGDDLEAAAAAVKAQQEAQRPAIRMAREAGLI